MNFIIHKSHLDEALSLLNERLGLVPGAFYELVVCGGSARQL
ncbi:hypothetical protein OpiT1DRAFT_02278 [Opitutaceae bacterium TAV1]|nr:hypothetical protein OpiT1DRAFT_02278 [Opitutaceae bacterium TAV1]